MPIRARGDSLPYRAGKFASRHRVGLASAAAALATVVVVAPLVIAERTRAAHERQRARQVETVLGHLFALPRAPEMPRALSAGDLVDHATRLVRRELMAQPASQARLLTALGDVNATLGRYEAAIDVLEDARAHGDRAFGPATLEAADTLVALAKSQHYAGRYDEAERNLRRAEAIRLDRLGPAQRETISVALELGDLLHTRGDLIAADRTLQDAIARLETAGAAPHTMSRALRDRGNVLRDRGDLAASEALFRESLRTLQGATFDASAQAAITEIYFARLLVRQRGFAEAGERLARSLQTLRAFYQGDHPMTAFALQNLGFLRMEEGRHDEADRRFDEAQRVALAWLGGGHPLVARIAADQSELLRRQGRIAPAIALAERTLAHFERIGLARHPSAIDAHWTLGQALLASGRPADAAAVLRGGLATAGRQYVAADRRIARGRQLLARALRLSTPSDVTSRAEPPPPREALPFSLKLRRSAGALTEDGRRGSP